MFCEKCPHLKEIETALAKCSCCLNAESHHGKIRVSESALTFSKLDADYETLLASRHDTLDHLTELPTETEDALKKLLAKFAELNFNDAPIALGLLQGLRLFEIADKIGLSLQCVHARYKSMISRAPWLAALHQFKQRR